MLLGPFDKELVYSYSTVLVILKRCGIISFSITLLSMVESSAQSEVSVGLFKRNKVNQILFSPESGSYVLINNATDTIYKTKTDDAISVSKSNGKLVVKSIYGFRDSTAAISFSGAGLNPSFKLKTGDDDRTYVYANDLLVTQNDKLLKLINYVDIDNYVSKVVQGEVGYGAELEYYRIQAIICRTYAYRNLRRHESEGYNLCDHEHCQVYKGHLSATDQVIEATATTNGLVMVDDKDQLILSAFHANCGGQTANSGDVWKEQKSYLTSVVDTFCVSERSAIWEKSINKSELVNQLGFKTEPLLLDSLKFNQAERKVVFNIGSDSILLSKARIRLRLRSTFFDLESVNDAFILKGRGYGHGVGLCQQGAMRMTTHGYNYSQILGYYYKGANLILYNSIQPPE